MSWQDTAAELRKKYGAEASGTESSGSWQDVAAGLMEKYSPEKYAGRVQQVSGWGDRYNDFLNRYSDYRKRRGYTQDFGGDFDSEITDLLQGYDEIKEFAGNHGLPNAQRYAGLLKDIRGEIASGREFMSQFQNEDAYNTYLEEFAEGQKLSQMQEKYNWGTVQELETALEGMGKGEDRDYLSSLYDAMSTQERYGGKTDPAAYANLSRRYEDASRAYFELRNQLGVYSSGGAMAGSRLESDPELEALRKQVEAAKAEYDALGAQKDELDRREWFSEKSDYYEPVSDAARTATVAKTKEEAKARYDELVKKWGEVEYTRSWDDPERAAIYNEMVAARQAYNAFGNSTYRYINNVDGYRDRLMETDKKQHNAEPFRKYDFMTADEIATYNYLYASEGKKAAEDYLDYLSYYLDKQNMQRQAQEFSEFADKHPVLASISSIPTNLVSGAGLVGTAIQKGASAISGEYKPVNFNTAAMAPSVATQAIRGTVAQKIIDATGTIQIDSEKNPVAAQLLNGKSWADVYQLGMSMADSAAVAGLSAIGIPGGTVLLGGSAGTQGMMDALERGATDGQAITMGILNGTFEALFEYVSLDKLLNGDVQKSALRQILEQAGVEASEEMCTTLANTFAADIPVMGDKSQLTQSMQEYRDAGLSEEEASRKAWADWGTDFLWDGIGGALSGGLMSGGKIAGTKIMDSILGTSYKAQYGGSARELVNDALALDPESKAAQKAQSTLEKGGELSGNQIRSVLQSINTHDKAAIQTAAEQRLKQLGETGDVSRLSAALAKQAAGETLNRSERRAIQFSHYGNQVAAELNPDTKYYENRAPEWRQKIGTSRFNTDEYNRLLPNSAPTQENDSATGKASVQAETTGYTVSEDGKTKRLSTGEEVGIQKIDSVQDGKMTFLLEDGSTVDASDIEYANEGEALIYEAVSGLGVSSRAANILVNGFSTSNDVSAQDYALGIQEAFQYGLWNAPAQDLNNGPFSSALTAHQRNVAYENGRIVARQRAELAQAAAEKRDGRKKEGKVHFDGDRSGLNQRQKASLSALQTVAKVLGVQIHVFESGVDAEGKHIGENGRYNPEDGSIYIDLYAGVSGQDTMLFTAAHELTHLIRQWSPAKFQVLAGFLMEQYGKHGVSVRSLVEEQISKAKRNKRTIDYDTAYEEVVADSMETMLADGKVVEKLAKLEQRDKSLWQKMKDYISSLAERIRKAYAGLKPDSVEGRIVAQMKDSVEKLQDLFYEGLADAGENFRESGEQKNTTLEGGEKYSLREFQDGVRFVDIQESPHVFEGLSIPEMNRKAKTILMEKFAGKVIGIDNRVFVNGDSINEYLHPSKYIDMETRTAKLTAAGELDNLLDAGKPLPNEADGRDGHAHPDAIDFSYFKTIFKIGEDFFEGIVNVKNIKRGKLLKDVTKIRNITEDIVSSYGKNPKSNFLRDASMLSIRNSEEDVKEKLSDRDPAIARMNQALEKENRKFREDVTELRKLLALQKSLTHGTMFTKSSVESMAGILMKNADAKGNRGELAGLLNEVYTYIARNQELTWEGVVEKAQPAVAWIQEHAQTRQQVDSYGTEVLRELRGSRISLDENQKKEVAYRFGSFDAYRKQLFGTVTITGKNAVPLDTKWAELAEMYPNVFDAGISSQDQPGALLDAIDSLREMGTVDNWYDQKEAAQDLLYQIYDGYWSVTTLHTVADVKQKQIDRLKGEHHARMDKLKASQKEQLAKLKQEHRDELRQVRQEYRADAEAKQQEVIQKYREAKQDSFLASRDAEIMEAEFLRLVNAYEKQSKQNDRAIADLEKALKKEARSHSSESKTWEQEFDRLMKQYEASDRNVKKLQEKVEAQRKSAKDKVESRNKTAMRSRIQGVVKELNDYLLKGTKDKHIPVELQKPVAAALDAINLDSVGAAMRIGELRQEVTIAEQENQRSQNLIIELAKKIGTLSSGSDESGQLLRKIVQENKAIESRSKSINDLHRKIENLETRDNKMGAHLSQLHDAYAAIANSSDPDVAAGYDEAVEELIAQTIQKVGNTPLRYMDMKQLNAVYDMYKAVLTRVKNANKAFKAARSATVSDLGQKVMQEVTDAGGKRKYSPAFLETIRKFGWDNLKPVYAFERIGSGTFSKIFKNIRAGEDTWVVDINEARSFFLKTAEKHSYHSWNNESRYEFTSTSGMKFSLNLEQIMSLYAYSKREQAADHLRKGGIVIDESTEVTIKTKIGVKVKFNPTEATAYNISGETLAEITGKLTPDQKAFVDEMQEFLSSTMGEKGNEVSLQLYGIKLFKEAYYFPLKSAPQFMKEAAEQQRGDRKIKNAGFSKETVKHASNPVVLTPFMNVWADHVNEMSMYHSFVLPMEDFYRVYNYKTPTTDLAATESVKMCIQNAYGKGATNYIDQLLKDLNGGALVDSTTGIINKSMNLFKKGAVFASASVVIQQPSAIARALSMIDAEYFVGPRLDRKGHKASWEELKRYAPVAAIKEMGYFDTNMGKSARDYILSKEYAGIKEKAKALFTDSGYRDEALSKAPALADEITWCSIWEAVKRETKSGNPGMDSKSEEFLKLAGERFTDVIVKTQVYDSVLSRSANMRSKDTGMKMATAFMAEPTTSINMIADALLKGKRGDVEGRRYCRRAIGSVVAAQILNAILVSFVYAARDDDEEETYWEKYAGSFVGEVLDGLNPAGYIPFVKDVVSIVQGYDVERSDMAVASDLWRACEQLGSDKLSVWRKVEGFAGSICQIFGLPLKNIMRDVRGMYQVIDSFTHSQKTTLAGTEYAIREAVTGKDVSNQEQLYQSYLRGDSEHIERVRNRYEGKDAYNAAMRAAIKRHFISGDIDEATALDYLVRYGGQDENESYWLLDKWKFTQEGESGEDYAKYNKFYAAVQTGKNIRDVIQEYITNGVSETTLAAQITSHFKPEYVKLSQVERSNIKGYLVNALELCGVKRDAAMERIGEWDFEAKYGFAYSDRRQAYIDGLVSAETLRKVLVTKGGYTEKEAEQQIKAYNWMKHNPQYDMDVNTVLAYIQPIEKIGVSAEASGIRPDTFLAYRNLRGNCGGVDSDGDGKADSGSVKSEVMEVINSLPITAKQKDALYYLNGWSESTISEAPWH